MDEEAWVNDNDLLMEAARYAVSQKWSRSKFTNRAKRCWELADAEARGAAWERERAKNAAGTNQQ
jgi:hypothetical protein